MGLIRERWVRAKHAVTHALNTVCSVLALRFAKTGAHQRSVQSRNWHPSLSAFSNIWRTSSRQKVPFFDAEMVRSDYGARTKALSLRHELRRFCNGGFDQLARARSQHAVRAAGAVGACALLFGLTASHGATTPLLQTNSQRVTTQGTGTALVATTSTTTTIASVTSTSVVATDSTTTSTTTPDKLKLLRDLGPYAPAGQKLVALTFDDGPGKATPEVLRILKEKRVKATFCVVGQNVQHNPEFAREIVAAGMGLCNHTRNHDLKISKKGEAEVRQQIQGGIDDIVAITGVRPTLVRLPGGAMSPEIVRVAHANGEYIAHWSVDPRDWTTPGADKIIQAVLEHVSPGAIVLLHDGDGGKQDAQRQQTVAALPIIIDELRAQGYEFVNLAELTPEYRQP